jgi:predicted dehydrogenase
MLIANALMSSTLFAPKELPQLLEAIAQAHHIPHAADNLDTLLALPEVQGVCISTPPFLHADMTQQALSAGKNVFLGILSHR